ncbi:MAG: glycosyl hydrolase [Bacteroidales bacterium]|nr:glycosyl hydrolase [Bacteroidales bacterium]
MKFLFPFFLFIQLFPFLLKADNKEKIYSTNEFLCSMGVCVHIQHGQNPEKLADNLNFIGINNVRDGADKNYNVDNLILLCKKTNSKAVIGPGSGAIEEDIPKVMEMAKSLHKENALLAIEGPNEPNNFGGIVFNNIHGGENDSWLPVAEFQIKFYNEIKKDKFLKKYPVFGISEVGATTDNVGLQFLEILKDGKYPFKKGTKFADFLNCHNYMYHPSWMGIHPNQIWNAASPENDCRVDGLYGNHCITWKNHFKGYEPSQLNLVPKVTTETGVRVGDENNEITEHIQGCNYMNLFLAQFKRGWTYTFIYELIDDGDGAFGFFKSDYITKRLSADYMHNFTSILKSEKSGNISVKIPKFYVTNVSDQIHYLLLSNDKNFFLIIWGEKTAGEEEAKISFDKNIKSINIYDPTKGVEMLNTEKNIKNISVVISDHPIILKISNL